MVNLCMIGWKNQIEIMKNNFIMEIKEVKAVKTVSGDLVYSIKLVTENPDLLNWGKISSDKLVRVELEEDV